MEDNVFNAQRYTELSLIEAVLGSFYILDYGFVSAVNPNGTINVTHAKRMTTRFGDVLPATVTKNIQVLSVSTTNFALNLDISKGDKVVLLGLKHQIDDVDDVISAEVTDSTIHYTRETIKALPLCVFNSNAKSSIDIEKGQMTIKTEGELVLNGSDNGGVVIGPELKKQLGYLTARVDTIINALINSPTVPQDGGSSYKAAITTALQGIVNKEDFSGIESDKIKHGTGA